MNIPFDYLKENESSTVKDISEGLALTTDQVRYLLIKGLDNEEIIKITGRPARYSINPEYDLEEQFEVMDSELEADIEDLEEAIKKDKPKRKNLNPQKQLNEMADNCMILGNIDMEYSKKERYWIFTKGDIQRKVKSKDLPAIRINLSEWIKENFIKK